MECDTQNGKWAKLPYHRRWLRDQANDLFDFFQHRAINPNEGFFDLDDQGLCSAESTRRAVIHASARMVHCYSIGYLLDRPGSGDIIDHGANLWECHRDVEYGGYFWQVNDDGAADAYKQSYGHAFELLAASSAEIAGHPRADSMLADITEVLETRFWEPEKARWPKNSSVTDRQSRAAAIAVRIPTCTDRSSDDRLRGDQRQDLSWSLGGNKHALMPETAKALVVQSMSLGWDKAKGAFFYTLDWAHRPAKTNKLSWPTIFLNEHLPSDSFYEASYRLIWSTIADRGNVLDHTILKRSLNRLNLSE